MTAAPEKRKYTIKDLMSFLDEIKENNKREILDIKTTRFNKQDHVIIYYDAIRANKEFVKTINNRFQEFCKVYCKVFPILLDNDRVDDSNYFFYKLTKNGNQL